MNTPTSSRSSQLMPMIIIGCLFFIFGFITWINGTLIPYLKIACELESDMQAYLVATAFFIAYTVMALPSSWVLGKTGYKKGMALGLVVMAVGTALFIPAAQSREFNMFLAGLFIIGSGLALLQTAANPYVSIIGPIESAASRISIMGICNKTAGILAGLIFGYIALKDADVFLKNLEAMDLPSRAAALDELAGRVVTPYIILTVALLVLAIAISFSALPDIRDEAGEGTESDSPSGKTSVLQFPHLVLGVASLFLYVGVEVMAGDTIISYGKHMGIDLSVSRFFTPLTLSCMLAGYVIGIFAIPKYITQEKALAVSAVLGAILTIGAVITTGYISVFCIALLGLANSLMWPAIFPLSIKGLGRFTKTGSALLIMAIAGGAILPLIYAWVSQHSSPQAGYWIMLPCYLFIGYFAVKGHKAESH